MENGNNNSNSGNNNNGATPDEIANAVFSFSESAIKLKDAGILFDETIALVNKVAQTALKKLNGFVYTDIGDVWWQEFRIGRLQTTAGVGLRFYISDTTPLTFGMGYPIHPEHKKDVRHFFFSIGVGF